MGRLWETARDRVEWLLSKSPIVVTTHIVVTTRERIEEGQHNAFTLGQDSVRPIYGPQPPRPRRRRSHLKAI